MSQECHFQILMLLMRVTFKWSISISEEDTDGQMVITEETIKHLPSITEAQHQREKAFYGCSLDI